jgi:hypothetical protein
MNTGDFVVNPWGAYFGAARDPIDPCVWVVGQYAKNLGGLSGGNDWGTVIAQVAHPSNSQQCSDYDSDGLSSSNDIEDDGDGFTDVAEAGSPLCLYAANDDARVYPVFPGPLAADDGLVNDGCPSRGTAESACADALDNDLDGGVNDGCPQAGAWAERSFKLGTSHAGRCGQAGFVTDPPSHDWPLDLVHGGTPNSTDLITVTDLTALLAPDRRLDTSPGHPFYDRRYDILPGEGPVSYNAWINVEDITAFFSGETGFPPMYGGGKAFGSTVPCTDP